MTRAAFIAAVLAALAPGALYAASDSYDMSALAEQKKSHPETEDAVRSGGEVYRKYCAGCHGEKGAGDGGSAPYLDPRPRDFTLQLFKFRSTKSGELPTDEDLFRTISRGVPGTAMPAWGEGLGQLSERERWEVTYYVKRLTGEEFSDPDFDPYQQLLDYPLPPGGGAQRVEAGKVAFSDEHAGGCIKCHGPSGRGNGPEAGTQRDDWGDAILPADLTKAWRYKNGTSVRQIYRTISTGMTGTPMPGYGETLEEDERWNLAYFVASLIEPHDDAGDRTLLVVRREQVPHDPTDEAWKTIPSVDIPLMGQMVIRPRHPNAAVDLVTMRAAHDGNEIALHLSWNDRTESRYNDGAPLEEIDDTYIPAKTLWARRKQKLPDSLQLQFPTKATEDGSLPFFYLGGGSGGGTVSLWRWFADRETGGGRAFEERLQKGSQRAAVPRTDEEQGLTGGSHYEDGRWQVVVRSKLTHDRKKNVTFTPGGFVPFSIQAWDGGHGEAGPIGSISSWQWLRLEAPTPPGAYLATVVGFGGTELLVLLAVWLARRSSRRNEH